MFCLKCGTWLDENAAFCPSCGAAQNNAAQPTRSPVQVDDGTPMKWYKFLIYFALFAGALINAINGFRMVSGSIYEGQADWIYAVLDGLKTLDMIVGLGLIAVAALQIYTRFRLAGFYSNAPQLLMLTYAAVVVVQLIYIIGIYMILPSSTTEYLNLTSDFIGIGISAVMIFVNKTYFDKRAHMFKN